jgi:hypothetical protein
MLTLNADPNNSAEQHSQRPSDAHVLTVLGLPSARNETVAPQSDYSGGPDRAESKIRWGGEDARPVRMAW